MATRTKIQLHTQLHDGTTISVDLDALTVIATGTDGEAHDLNAEGDPCRTVGELAAFVRELHEQGSFGAAVRDDLLAGLDQGQSDGYDL